MEAASGEYFTLLLILCERAQVSSQCLSPVFAQTVAQFRCGQAQGPGERPGKMFDQPPCGFKTERAVPTVARQRQVQTGRLYRGDYLRRGMVHSIIGRR